MREVLLVLWRLHLADYLLFVLVWSHTIFVFDKTQYVQGRWKEAILVWVQGQLCPSQPRQVIVKKEIHQYVKRCRSSQIVVHVSLETNLRTLGNLPGSRLAECSPMR